MEVGLPRPVIFATCTVGILQNSLWDRQTMTDEEKMKVGLPRPVIFTTCTVGILHKQSVRRTNNDRWGENGGGITQTCYHHMYSMYLAQTVCETDKQWQMRRKCMEVGLPRSVIFTTRRYLAQAVCETDKHWQMRRKWRWDYPACYLHHVYSRYLAQTVCKTDKQWQMRRKWRWDYPDLLSSPCVQ